MSLSLGDRVSALALFMTQALEHDIALEQKKQLQSFACMNRLIKCPGKILTVIFDDKISDPEGPHTTRDGFRQILSSLSDWSRHPENMIIPIRTLTDSNGNWTITLVPGPLFTQEMVEKVTEIIDNCGEPFILVVQNHHGNVQCSKIIDFNINSTTSE